MACVLLAGTGAAHAQQTYPVKSIPLTLPYTHGGSTRAFGYFMQQKLADSLGQQIVIGHGVACHYHLRRRVRLCVAKQLSRPTRILSTRLCHSLLSGCDNCRAIFIGDVMALAFVVAPVNGPTFSRQAQLLPGRIATLRTVVGQCLFISRAHLLVIAPCLGLALVCVLG
jgi:hypothetical protein